MVYKRNSQCIQQNVDTLAASLSERHDTDGFPAYVRDNLFGIVISYIDVKAMCYSHDSHILMYQNYSGKEVTYDENNPDRRRPGILGGSE